MAVCFDSFFALKYCMDYAPGVKKKGNEIITLTVVAVVQVPAWNSESSLTWPVLKFFRNVVPSESWQFNSIQSKHMKLTRRGCNFDLTGIDVLVGFSVYVFSSKNFSPRRLVLQFLIGSILRHSKNGGLVYKK